MNAGQSNPIDFLLFDYFENRLAEGAVQRISAWLDESPSNRTYFANLKKAYIEIQSGLSASSLSSSTAFAKFQARVDEHLQRQRSETRRTIRKRITDILKYAAVFCIGLGCTATGYYFGQQKLPKDAGRTSEVVVPYGGKSVINLPDGSKVWLNAGSTLNFSSQYGVVSRDIDLNGEALFEVQKQETPFIVHTSYLDIRALGTTFNVKSYPEESRVETTLVEGEVEIANKKTTQHFVLKPNQKLTLNVPRTAHSGDPLSSADSLWEDVHICMVRNTRGALSWKEGTLVFEKETLEELTKKLERKYDVTFLFVDESLKHYTYTGTLRDFPLEQVLKALQMTSPVRYTIHERIIKLNYNNDFQRMSVHEYQRDK